MKTNLPRIGTQTVAALVAAAGLAWLAGCAGHQRAPVMSGLRLCKAIDAAHKH